MRFYWPFQLLIGQSESLQTTVQWCAKYTVQRVYTSLLGGLGACPLRKFLKLCVLRCNLEAYYGFICTPCLIFIHPRSCFLATSYLTQPSIVKMTSKWGVELQVINARVINELYCSYDKIKTAKLSLCT